jgi:hypothetical protein
MFHSFLKSGSSLLFILSLIICTRTAFAGEEWKTISPEELALKSPKIEADADAEALFWEVYVADEAEGGSPRTVLRHYVRIKVFTEKGREDNSKVDIAFGKLSGYGVDIRIKDIAARTIKPDGSIVELTAKDIFEREIVKANRIKIKAKSFAVPGIEVGSIIEYRWKEIRGETLSFYDRLQFAREIPVHLVKYHIKPISLPGFPYGMRAQVFNGANTPFTKEKDGFYMTSMSNVPSFKEEPRMPDEYGVRPWMLLYYAEDKKLEPQKFWEEHGKGVFQEHKEQVKVKDEIKKVTAEAVGDAAEPMQKIERIFNYVRANVKNVYDDTSGFTAEQIQKMKDNKNAADVLKRGMGNWHDINMLFASMVSAAGLEVRITKLPRKADINFNVNFPDDYFMRTENVAVRIGEGWKFFDPSSRYIPFGMLSWQEEGQPVLISDSKTPLWGKTPHSAPEKSMEKRTGKFRLLEDGTLEGEVRMEFTGHVGVYHKEYNDDDNPGQREQTLRNIVKASILGSAEISDFTIENVSDPDKPFIYTFKIRVPGYATRTGKRLFLQPNVFERSARPMFSANNRRYDVSINYPWAETDDLTIELPAGYELESPDAPEPTKDNQGISLNDIKISITQDRKTLVYRRNFYFGNGGFLYFPVKSYAAVKGLFDMFHRGNTHQLTLRQAAVAPPPPAKSN